MKTSRKYSPLLLALLLGAAACAVRCVLMFLYSDEQGEYSGSRAVLYLLAAVLIAALVLYALWARKRFGKLNTRIFCDGDFASVFVYACVGFFQLFSLAFMAYALVSGSPFFEGDSTAADLLIMLASLFTALLFFIKATGKEKALQRSPFYALLYIFPVGWSLIRLFVLFVEYSTMALYTAQKLQVLSLVVLTVYFLYEARLYYAPRPMKLSTYISVSALTVVLVPLSALPSFLKSLFLNESANLGEPILCLVELAMCAVAAAGLANALKAKEEE